MCRFVRREFGGCFLGRKWRARFFFSRGGPSSPYPFAAASKVTQQKPARTATMRMPQRLCMRVVVIILQRGVGLGDGCAVAKR
jgi:hypothetical protein